MAIFTCYRDFVPRLALLNHRDVVPIMRLKGKGILLENTAYISLGGNMGDEEVLFTEALSLLSSNGDIHVVQTSRIYITEPQEDTRQPWFQNQVAELLCEGPTAHELLLQLLAIEDILGRQREGSRRFGPRRIDLDLLFFGDIVCNDIALTLPHPRLAQRAFVLVPLHEIAPDLVLPDGRTIAGILKRIDYALTGKIIYQSGGNSDGKSK